MAREDTQFKPGNKGGPGKPRGRTVRSALRQYLAQPNPEVKDETREDTAARKLWETADASPTFLLDVLKWLEGSSPKESETDSEIDEPPATDEHGNPIEP